MNPAKLYKKHKKSKFCIFVFDMVQNNRQIFDPVRKKRVAATPEEVVRQNLISYLNKECNTPLGLMSCEYSFEINGNKYRSDLVIFNSLGKPLLLAECKAPSVAINEMVFDQIFTYNYNLKVKYLLLTNGKSTYCAKADSETGKINFISSIPKYNELSEQ